MGKRSREKGAAAERYAARILQILYPDAQRRVSGEEGQGEKLGRDLKGTPGLCVQVKEHSAPRPLEEMLEEVLAAREQGEIAAVFVRKARRGTSCPFRVVVTLRDFLRLMAAYRGMPPGAERAHLEALMADEQMKARIG